MFFPLSFAGEMCWTCDSVKMWTQHRSIDRLLSSAVFPFRWSVLFEQKGKSSCVPFWASYNEHVYSAAMFWKWFSLCVYIHKNLVWEQVSVNWDHCIYITGDSDLVCWQPSAASWGNTWVKAQHKSLIILMFRVEDILHYHTCIVSSDTVTWI